MPARCLGNATPPPETEFQSLDPATSKIIKASGRACVQNYAFFLVLLFVLFCAFTSASTSGSGFCAGVVRGWLRGLRKSGTPLIVGTVLLPVQVVDTAAEKLGNVIYR